MITLDEFQEDEARKKKIGKDGCAHLLDLECEVKMATFLVLSISDSVSADF